MEYLNIIFQETYKILFSFLLTVAEIFAIDKLENWIEKLYLSIFELDNNTDGHINKSA